ncbi:MAG: NYN domain-containing protein [Pseudomonadota bacterium]
MALKLPQSFENLSEVWILAGCTMDLSPFSVSTTKARVAILVDGDNIPHVELSVIESVANNLGNTAIRRVYGDMTVRKEWASEINYLTIHCSTAHGKNRADVHLVIGALDIAHRGLATSFLIVSDDKDFGPLVAYLREIGLTAEQIGKQPQKTKAVPSQTVVLSKLDQKIHDLFHQSKAELSLQHIGSQMRNGKVKEQTGKATWRAYLTGKPDLYKLVGTGGETVIRLISAPHTAP